MLKELLEFYFSDKSLDSNKSLRELYISSDGFVDLEILLSFSKVKSMEIYTTAQLADAIDLSSLLVMDETGTKVGRIVPYDPKDLPTRHLKPSRTTTEESDRRTIYIERIPAKFTVENVKSLIVKLYGELLPEDEHGKKDTCITYVTIPRTENSDKNKGFCFVELDSEELQSRILAAPNPKYRIIGKSEWLILRDEYKQLLREAQNKLHNPMEN